LEEKARASVGSHQGGIWEKGTETRGKRPRNQKEGGGGFLKKGERELGPKRYNPERNKSAKRNLKKKRTKKLREGKLCFTGKLS